MPLDCSNEEVGDETPAVAVALTIHVVSLCDLSLPKAVREPRVEPSKMYDYKIP
jgi:hypothetical protein